MQTRGFTLIELLVVIAIIGLLAFGFFGADAKCARVICNGQQWYLPFNR